MEWEQIFINLSAFKEAVVNNQELILDNKNENLFSTVSKAEFEGVSSQIKDKTKFLLSKMVSYAPTVFDENAEMKEWFMGHMNESQNWLNTRGMAPVAELLVDFLKNETARDAWYNDDKGQQGKLGT